MKTMLMTLTLLLGALGLCSAEISLHGSIPAANNPFPEPDPLTRQIMHRNMTQANGGVTAAVRIASGQSIELKVVELYLGAPADAKAPAAAAQPAANPLGGLDTASGLKAAAKTKKSRLDKNANDQLKTVDKQGWKTGR